MDRTSIEHQCSLSSFSYMQTHRLTDAQAPFSVLGDNSPAWPVFTGKSHSIITNTPVGAPTNYAANFNTTAQLSSILVASLSQGTCLELIFLPVGLALPLARIVVHILCHSRPRQTRAGCPRKCPFTPTFWLYCSQHSRPLFHHPELSRLALLYFWEGNSVSGPTSAAPP